MKQRAPGRASLARSIASGWLLAALGCASNNNDQIAALEYECGNVGVAAEDAPGADRCGAGDPLLPPEPTLPADPTDPQCILTATRVTPPEGSVLDEPVTTDAAAAKAATDTALIQTALNNCAVVKLVTNGANDAFLSSHLDIIGKILWIDKGVTLFASRNPALYQSTGNCGVLGVNDSAACVEFLGITGNNPGIVGDGTIDGQGGEPLVGKPYSWWQMSYALRAIDGSIGNPTLILTKTNTKGFLLYRVTIHNSPKFHVKLTSLPVDGVGPGVCDSEPYGKGFIVWGIKLLTPSKWYNSAGYLLTPSYARNTDGVDPGETNIAYCGVIACNTISTGDDHIAIKGGHGVQKLTIAHNHFGTGHGMSIGSETYGSTTIGGVTVAGVQNIHVYDLTVDADSRPVGSTGSPSDFNGIRVKTDESRGGIVDNLVYEDICLRDMVNAVLVSTAYNPLFAGDTYPDFRNMTFRNLHHVTCMSKQQPIVKLSGYNTTLPATINLDNFIIDNFDPTASAYASYATVNMGPGNVNVIGDANGAPTLQGHDFVLHDNIDRSNPSTPRECQFPVLPTPNQPPGWLF
jgi:polygalacturonase